MSGDASGPTAMDMLRNKRAVQTVILVLVGTAALISLGQGIRHAFQYGSHDLQWMGGRLLAHHVDPWQEKLANYPHAYRHFSPPNYLPLLYLLFIPLSSLSFISVEVVWCVTSICFSIGSVLLLRRLFLLSRFQALLLLFLLWMSSPFRVVLEVGQVSLFELFFFCLTFSATSIWLAGIAFGVASTKYSFSPVAAVLFLLRGRVSLLLMAAVVLVLALVGAWLFVPTPVLRLLREPFLVSRTAVSPGVADLMTLAESALKPYLRAGRAQTASYALAAVGSCCYAALLRRYRLSRGAELALVSVASLLLFKHLIYDYVFLVVPLAYAFTVPRLRVSLPIFAGVFVFWVLSSFLNRSATDAAVYVPGLAMNFCLLLALLAYLTRVILGDGSLPFPGEGNKASSAPSVILRT